MTSKMTNRDGLPFVRLGKLTQFAAENNLENLNCFKYCCLGVLVQLFDKTV